MPNAAPSQIERAGATRAEVERLAAIIKDPVQFARKILRHDPWETAEQILRSVATNRRTAVKACHASSKSFTASEAVLWWTIRYADGIVLTTAPTWSQVEKVLWGEVRKAAERSRIALPKLNKTELPLSAGNYALGLSTNEGVRFQGFHGKLLIVLDEGPGVLGDIYDAIEGMRAGGDVHVLLLGNPIVPSGPFHAAFTKDAASWQRFTISAFDTPNLAGLYIVDPRDGSRIGDAIGRDLTKLRDEELDQNVRPYLATRRWVREKLTEWGCGHPKFDSRVLGVFPAQSEFALVPLAWAEAAETLKPSVGDNELEAGIDVAGPGDAETTLFVRRGPNVIFAKGYSEADPRGAVAADLQPFQGQKVKQPDGRSVWQVKLKVDTIGIGYNFARHFEDLGYDVVDINVGEGAYDNDKFAKLKDELYWGLRERFEQGRVGGLTDAKTQAQLTAIEYEHTPSGQVRVLSKDQLKASMKNRTGDESFDRAEGVMLCFAKKRTLPARRWDAETWGLSKHRKRV